MNWRPTGETVKELLAGRPLEPAAHLAKQIVGQGHTRERGPRLEFSMNIIGDVSDLNHH
jgi:hypothetical protein